METVELKGLKYEPVLQDENSGFSIVLSSVLKSKVSTDWYLNDKANISLLKCFNHSFSLCYRLVMSTLPHRYHVTMLIVVSLRMGKWQIAMITVCLWKITHIDAATLCIFPCFSSNINGDVMATFRLVFRVSKIQQYSDNFVQDLLRAGLSSVMHGKPLEVPEYGEINAIILLGKVKLVHCLLSYKRMSLVCITNISCTVTDWRLPQSPQCVMFGFVPSTGASGKSFYAIGDEMLGGFMFARPASNIYIWLQYQIVWVSL